MILKKLAHELLDEYRSEIHDVISQEISKLVGNNSVAPQKPYLKRNEVCKLMSCSANTLREICIEYNIKPKKVIGAYYYRRSDLDRVFQDWPE